MEYAHIAWVLWQQRTQRCQHHSLEPGSCEESFHPQGSIIGQHKDMVRLAGELSLERLQMIAHVNLQGHGGVLQNFLSA